MSAKSIPIGKFRIDVGSIPKSSVGRVQLTRALNLPTTCRVSLQMSAEDLANLGLGSIPMTASIEIEGRPVFKGQLIGVETGSSDHVQLIYSDPLYAAGRSYPNTCVKDCSLTDCLKNLTGELGISTQFTGDFSATLPAYHFSGKSILQQLQDLSLTHGFFFTYYPPKESLVFIKSGNSLSSTGASNGGTVAAPDYLDSYELKQGQPAYFKKMALEYYDSKQGSQSATLTPESIYSGVSQWLNTPSFEAKKAWKLSSGSVEVPLADESHFKEGETLLKGRLSRQIMEQERLRATTHHYFPHPGEKLTLSQTRVPKMQDGEFLIESVTIYLEAAVPRTEFTAIRA